MWFFCWNSKTTTSPALAVMFEGEYVSDPSAPPTTTVCVAGAAAAAVDWGTLASEEGALPYAGASEEGAPYAGAPEVADGAPAADGAAEGAARAADEEAAA